MSHLSYIEISEKALLHNIGIFRNILPAETSLVAVVKANAYGHGLTEVAPIIEPLIDYFQVDDIEELRVLRAITQKPILVLGYVQQTDLAEAVKHAGILTIYDTERLKTLSSLGPVKVQLKIDALLGRQGILLEHLEDFLQTFSDYPNITLDGIYAHFANIEDTSDFSHAEKQIGVLEKAVEITRKQYPKVKTHISATSGILANAKVYDLARLGIGLYGMWPSSRLQEKHRELALQPVLRWITHIAQVKEVPAGFPVGYGLTYVTDRPTKLAIIPQGYGDGYDRGLSNCGEVLIKGTLCPIRGRVAMNMFAVDVTHLSEVKAEDEVILIGKQNDKEITAEEIAAKIDTINYEVTTRISPLLPRLIF